MSDRAKAAYFLAALVAVFVLAWFVGGLAAPWLDRDGADPAPVRHDPPSDVPTDHPSHTSSAASATPTPAVLWWLPTPKSCPEATTAPR